MPSASVPKAASSVYGHIFLCHPGHYFSLANDLIDHHAKTIGIIGVGLSTALARYAHRKTGECWPSIGRLAHLLDCASQGRQGALLLIVPPCPQRYACSRGSAARATR